MIELHDERADGSATRLLVREFVGLLAERVGGGFAPSARELGSLEDFERPGAVWLVLYEDGIAVGCGGLRPAGAATAEIKRMFVSANARRRGYGRRLLAELEGRAATAGFRRVGLLTADVLPEARAMYEAAGYRPIRSWRHQGRTEYWYEKAL